MPGGLADLGTVEADVREGAVVELGELLHGSPVAPPRGERPDERGEVHFRHPSMIVRAPDAARL